MIDTANLTGKALDAAENYNKVLQQQILAQQANTTATENAVKAEMELAKLRLDNAMKRFENRKDYYEGVIDYKQSAHAVSNKQAELSAAPYDYMTKNEYKTKTKGLNSENGARAVEMRALL